ncbi:MAG: hypothetical protein IPJ77_19590 [Planctomycetes bacterium]|nr:hypothetical protein [Planctomycetota bacterium]
MRSLPLRASLALAALVALQCAAPESAPSASAPAPGATPNSAPGATPEARADAPTSPIADGPAAAKAKPAPSAFLAAARCALCHSQSPRATALTTATGSDASPHGLWKATPMAQSFRDPYWRAQVAREVEAAPAARAAIEELSTRCHAPAAHHDARIANATLASVAELAHEPLATDGVTCTVCHQAQPENLGTPASFAGHLDIRPEKRIFGPYASPATGPMRMHTGYTPTHGPHVSTSALCGACHTLHTAHAPNADAFLEQAPYLEWRNSVYSDEAGKTAESRTCQECHMPDQGPMKIAHNPGGRDFNITTHAPVRGHALVGGNALLLDLFAKHGAALGTDVPKASFEAMAAATRAQLAHATATLELAHVTREAGRLAFDVAVTNKTGHKFPSGYPSRRAWLALEVRSGSTTVFASGAPDAKGRIAVLEDELAQRHVDQVSLATDVPIYEMLADDADGKRTTSLARMAKLAKDTRLLPRGWRADGPHADETRPVGVDGDQDFGPGGDVVHASIALPKDASGKLTVIARLYYQPIPPAWADALRASKTDEAKVFLSMYDGADTGPETVAIAVEIVE